MAIFGATLINPFAPPAPPPPVNVFRTPAPAPAPIAAAPVADPVRSDGLVWREDLGRWDVPAKATNFGNLIGPAGPRYLFTGGALVLDRTGPMGPLFGDSPEWAAVRAAAPITVASAADPDVAQWLKNANFRQILALLTLDPDKGQGAPLSSLPPNFAAKFGMDTSRGDAVAGWDARLPRLGNLYLFFMAGTSLLGQFLEWIVPVATIAGPMVVGPLFGLGTQGSQITTVAQLGLDSAGQLGGMAVSPSIAAAVTTPLQSVLQVSDLASAPTPPPSLFAPEPIALGSGIPPPPAALNLSAAPVTLPAPVTASGASAMDLTQFLDLGANVTGDFAAGPIDFGLGFDPFAPLPGSDFILTSSTGGIPLETFYDLGAGGLAQSGGLSSSASSLSDIFGQIGGAIKAGAGAVKSILGARQTAVAPRPAPTLAARAGSSNMLGIALLALAGWFALKG